APEHELQAAALLGAFGRPANTPGDQLAARSARPAAPSVSARYRRALGATSRVADQFLPALTVDVCESPAVGAASPISLGSTWPSRPALGVSKRTYPPSASGVLASTSASTRSPSSSRHHSSTPSTTSS